MDRLLDDASNIQSVLPWIESQEEILEFLRSIPLDQFHRRIQLALRYFIEIRDESEGNSEQRIEDDAREIVILLPDTPYNLIKNRLRELGYTPNRKEILIRKLLNERTELGNILDKIKIDKAHYEKIQTNNLRKRLSAENSSSNNLSDKETNIKIKIRKIEGSLEVVSFVQQDFPTQKFRKSPAEEAVTSQSSSTHCNQEMKTSCLNNCAQNSPVVSVVINNAKEVPPPPPPQTYNLLEYLKELTQASEDTIKKICLSMKVPTNKQPTLLVLNELLNKIYDQTVIEVDDNDSSNSSMNSSYHSMENTPAKDSLTKDEPKSILKPATLVFNNQQLSVPSTSYASAGSFTVTKAEEFVPDTISIPAIPQEYLDRIVLRDEGPTTTESVVDPSQPLVREEDIDIIPTTPTVSKSKKYDKKLGFPTGYPLSSCPTTTESVVDPTQPLVREEDIDIIPTTPTVSKSKKYDKKLGFPTGYPLSSCPTTTESVVDPSQPLVQEEEDIIPTTSTVSRSKKYDEKLVLRLIEIFPEACPDYVRKLCEGKKWKQLDDLVTVILSEDYPKRPQRAPSPPKEVDIDEQLEIVKALLPDADPTYLRWICESMGNDADQLNSFINDAREQRNYPTMKEYLRKQKFMAQSKQYTTEFNVENFVELFPDPETTFRDPKRTMQVDNYASLYICNFFQIRYDRLPLRTIRFILTAQKYKILQSDDEMQKVLAKGPLLKSRRKLNCLDDPPNNIQVLQELAYLNHKKEIENFIEEKKRLEEEDRKIAKESGLMNVCQCCFDDEVMPKNAYSCPAGCVFCNECILKSCEVAVGDGKTEFKCLNHCQEEFSLQVLQKVLPPKMFSKLAQKKALAEVKAAGIEELETCPFCDFASIPNAEDKIFRCLNPDCMKESCRSCKEENHLPYKCDEIEKDEDVKARVFVENQMTEALLCKCYKCGTSFFKEEGCNKMTCTCGAKMCYICKQPVTDYSHFNGIGGDKFHLCPLYSDTNELNKKNVTRAAENAKSKVDPTKLKVDPSLDVQQHYNSRRQQLPVEPHLELLNMQRVDLQRARERLNRIQEHIAFVHRHRHHHHHHH